jgi:uncharacterized protein YggE
VDPIIAVPGIGTVEADPERAAATVAVEAGSADRGDAVRRLEQRRAAVQAVLDEYGEALERVTGGGVHVDAEYELRRGSEKIRGWAGHCRWTLSFRRLDAVGDVLARLLQEELSEIDGPWWSLRPDSAAYREARVLAVADARQRAEEYAAALGVRLTGLVELVDEQADRPGRHVALAAMGRRSGWNEGDEPLVLDLTPERQQAQVVITARFSTTQPDFG